MSLEPTVATGGTVKIPRCIVCKEEIASEASQCQKCGSYQRAWKNHLQYGAGIATLVVLGLSGMAWLSEKAISRFSKDDVRVVSLNSLGSAVMLNSGHREVFVSHVLLTMRIGGEYIPAVRLDVQESLAPGRFLQKRFPRKIKGDALFIAGLNFHEFEAQVRQSMSDECLELAFFDSTNSFPTALDKGTRAPTPNTFEVSGYLEYMGAAGGVTQVVPITGVGMLRRNFAPQCNRRSIEAISR
jgi:hypothetical protein